ncbi:MAG: ABC transporter ATP-binding protein [Deltaproteobacteria bacterium]|nr:ABC transporter ATP-binding protein [Deltaproteobacteria bacterium]
MIETLPLKPRLETPNPKLKALLRVTDLSVRIDTRKGLVRPVDGVSFSLDSGRTLGIVGESGCGKTMLCRALIRLLPPGGYIVRGAEMRFNGVDMGALSEKLLCRIRGRDMAMVFQNPMTALNPVMRVGKQIGENLRLHTATARKDVRDATVNCLRQVGMPHPDRYVDCYPHQLSGGMRQRVVIAVALCCRPKLLIADEPTTALDVTVQAEILRRFDRLQDKYGMSIILVTHNLAIAANHADEVAVMYGGKIVEYAPTDVLFSRMRHPYTRTLMGAVPRLDAPAGEPFRTIEGQPPDLSNPPMGCGFADRCQYVRPICHRAVPPLTGCNNNHRFACFFPLDEWQD